MVKRPKDYPCVIKICLNNPEIKKRLKRLAVDYGSYEKALIRLLDRFEGRELPQPEIASASKVK